MVNVRGIAPERLAPMHAASPGEMRLELWLVPKGATLPRIDSVEDTTKATLFDTYRYWTGEYNICGAGRNPSLTDYAKALRQRPEWRGYIVVRRRRGGGGDDGWQPDSNVSRAQASRRAAKDKEYLVRKFKLPRARLAAAVGSDADWTHAELWLVPPGVEPPPTSQPKSSSR